MLPPVGEKHEGAAFFFAFLFNLQGKMQRNQGATGGAPMHRCTKSPSVQFNIRFEGSLQRLSLQWSSIDSFIQLCVSLDGGSWHCDENFLEGFHLAKESALPNSQVPSASTWYQLFQVHINTASCECHAGVMQS